MTCTIMDKSVLSGEPYCLIMQNIPDVQKESTDFQYALWNICNDFSPEGNQLRCPLSKFLNDTLYLKSCTRLTI